MARKRGHGEGSIYQLPNGNWRAQVTIGRDAATGRLIRKSITGKTRQEVSRKMTDLLSKVQAGNYIEPSSMTVEQWFGDWLEGRRPHIEEKTYKGHELMIRRHIVPTFGKVRLADLRTRDVQKLINQKMESGLSVRTVKYIYTTLNQGFKQAIRERIVTFNPMEAVELPKLRRKEMEILTPQEMASFLEAAKESKHYAAFVLELATGLRRGELLALRWGNIDFKKGTLAVKEQLVRADDGLIFKSYLKTQKSRRTINLPESVLAVLKAHKKQQSIHQAKLKLKLGNDAFKEYYQDNDLLFCAEDGKPIDPDSFGRHFKALLKKAGVKQIRFHDLRHSFATMALEAGIPVKTVQEMLGHTTSAMVMEVYSHVTPAMQKEAAKKIGQVLGGVINGG